MRIMRIVGTGMAIALLAGGCTTSSMERHRFAPYRPVAPKPTPIELADAAIRKASPPKAAPESRVNEVPPRSKGPEPKETEPKVEEPETSGRSVLKEGDRVKISVQTGDRPMEIGEEVDDTGAVTLPHIGDVIIAGMTTAEAEAFIRERYIEEDIFSKLTVTVVAEMERYFVRGHVRKNGEFPLTPSLTLSQALTIAGFDPYASRKKIELIRDNQMSIHNLDQIEEGRDPDPALKAGDKINVPQKGPFDR